MPEKTIITQNNTSYLKIGSGEDTRVFLPSQNINIFPCSRRGQSGADYEYAAEFYDPEARLNTERTNRLHAATNGFKDSFIGYFDEVKSEDGNGTGVGTLVFTLAGYHVEVKAFNPADLATTLEISDGIIYAHLSLHAGVSLNVTDYFTEILYRQPYIEANKNYLDVSYPDVQNSEEVFFVGISFTSKEAEDVLEDAILFPHNLALFSKAESDEWKLVQTSLLPKVEHDTEPDSIKLSGDFTVVHPVLNEDGTPVLDTDGKPETQESFKVTKDATLLGPTVMSSLIVGEMTEGETFTKGTLKVKNRIETPTVSVNTITSDSDKIEVNKALLVEGKTEIAAILNVSETITAKDVYLEKVGQVPALELAQLTEDTYQVRFKFGTPLAIKDERPKTT